MTPSARARPHPSPLPLLPRFPLAVCRSPLSLLFLLPLLLPAPSLACRYTVRDIAFIPIAEPSFTLELELPDAAGDAIASQAEAIMRDALADVRLHTSITRADRPDAGLELRDAHRSLQLAQGPPEAIHDWLPPALDRLAASPSRDRLAADTHKTFAFLLLLESTDPPANASASRAIGEALELLRSVEADLPRPIDLPISTLAIPHADDETVTRFALGLDPDATQAQPAVAVLYGRLKRAGPLMTGPDITTEEILRQLVTVGQSCECETARDWAAEPQLPHRWPPARRDSAAKSLGFDPDNPVVQMEAVRIIQRGRPAPANPLAAQPDQAELLFGYREITVGEDHLIKTNAASEPVPPAAPAEPEADDVERLVRKAIAPATNPDNESATQPAETHPVSDEHPASPFNLFWLATTALLGFSLAGAAIVALRRKA